MLKIFRVVSRRHVPGPGRTQTAPGYAARDPGHPGTRENIRDPGNSETILSLDGKGSIVVLGGGQFLMSKVLLYGTDLTEMRCLCTGVLRF